MTAPTDEPSAHVRRRLLVSRRQRTWRTATGITIAALLGACGPIQQTGEEWALVRATSCAEGPAVNSAAALDLADRRLGEMDPANTRHDVAEIRGEPLLACGLRVAHHTASWSYHADGRDIWLLSFHEDDELAALAAIDATTGTVLSITYGQWTDVVAP